MDEYLEFATGLAKTAGQMMLDYFDADQKVEIKADNSPVTIADKLINDFVIKEIAKKYPEHGVVGEEASTDKEDQEYVWFCDPIDGTKAFTWGLPTAMFSLALVTKGRPVMSVVYDPFLDRMYTAIKGQGSFCNGERLQVSNLDLKTGVMAATAEVERYLTKKYEYILSQKIRLAVFSGFCYKACLIAQGKLIGHAEDNTGRHDLAAVELIVLEAGGKVTNFSNEPLDYTKPLGGTVVSNGVVHEDLLRIVQIK